MLVFMIIVFSAMAITLWYLRHPRPEKSRPGKAQHSACTQHPYHAVSIRRRGGACSVANAAGSRRFLASGVPQLPLPSCDARNCGCRYVHHDDRRHHDNRRMLYSMRSDLYVLAGHNERRGTRGRRQSDKDANLASTFDLGDIDLPVRANQ